MATVDASQTIGEILSKREETRLVFHRYRIPAARMADVSLADVCAERGIDEAELVRDLEQAIDESEAFEVGGFEWDVRSNIVKLSPNLARIVDTTELSQPWREILDKRVHADDRARVERLFAEAVSHRCAFSFEYRIVRTDGATRLFASRVEPIEGEPPSFIGTTWDITEQQGRHSIYDASSSTLQSALEATIDGILVIDRAGNTVLTNARFLSMWRIPPEIAVKATDEAMIQFVLDQLVDPSAFLAGVEQLYASPERESFDVLRFKDGRVFERYSRPQHARFAIIGRVWSFRDVTERERLLARQTFLLDASRLLGSLDMENALAAVTKAIVPYLGSECTIEVFRKTSDGRATQSTIEDVRGVSTLAVPIVARCEPIGLITITGRERHHTRADLDTIEELARRIALAVENARLFREVQEAATARDEFLSIAAHEIRGPLASIHLAVQTLRRYDVSAPGREKLLDLVEREDRKLARFVDDIIDAASIRTRGLHFEDSEVDLVGIVHDVAESLAPELVRSRSTLSIDASEPIVGRWDRLRLEQVVGNLLRNALKFGLGKPIRAIVDARDGQALLTVSDLGLGVEPEQREAIFEPFRRAVPVRHYGGLGLGLFIVRTIIERYGGSVRVLPQEGGSGSQFVVRLPKGRSS